MPFGFWCRITDRGSAAAAPRASEFQPAAAARQLPDRRPPAMRPRAATKGAAGSCNRFHSRRCQERSSPLFDPFVASNVQGLFDGSVPCGLIRRLPPRSPRAVKRAGLRTMLPSGPRRPSLHSVLRGGISLLSGLRPASRPRVGTDASPRPCAPEIRVSRWQTSLRAVRSDQRLASSGPLPGSYSSSVFHMASTIAAICRATVSLARFGFVPFSSCRS